MTRIGEASKTSKAILKKVRTEKRNMMTPGRIFKILAWYALLSTVTRHFLTEMNDLNPSSKFINNTI